MTNKKSRSLKLGYTIPFCVADRPASLRILKGSYSKSYKIPMGIMAHANTSKNFQRLFRMYPCSEDSFCDVINKKCPYDKKISKCPEGRIIRRRTIKMCDSGIFTKDGCMPQSYEELFAIYEYMGVKYGIINDYFKDKKKTVKSARKALKVYENLYGKKKTIQTSWCSTRYTIRRLYGMLRKP